MSSNEHTIGAASSLEAAKHSSVAVGPLLPRSLPLVGFIRHAPKQALIGQLERLLFRRAEVSSEAEPESSSRIEKLLRASPYVGFQRHAPPSPTLSFSAPQRSSKWPQVSLLPACLELEGEEQLDLPGALPSEGWANILSFVVEFAEVIHTAAVSRAMLEVVMAEGAWHNRIVRVPPSSLPKLAPKLSNWLSAWRSCKKLVIPRSDQLVREISRRDPELSVEVAWRFDKHLKGDGVQVINEGRSARRVASEELVVLGDAALPWGPNRSPYLEVQLDQRAEAVEEMLNDFGFGVTACDPEAFRKALGELGAVADEIPCSWVVDFTQSTVCLSINNREAAKSDRLCADHLKQGDRVGLLITTDAFEIYINGELRERLLPALEECVPENVQLFPVLDLFGRTIQISRTDSEGPLR